MKRSLSFLALMSFMAISFFVSSCDKLNDTTEPTMIADEYDAPAYYANVPFVDNSVVTVATETEPFQLLDNSGLGTNTGSKLTDLRPIVKNPFAPILRALNLTEEQKAQVKEFITAYQKCNRLAMQQLMLAQKAILEPANAERRDIMAKVKAGTITRKEAADLLAALNKRVNEALRTSPEIKAAIAAIKKCDDDFLASLKSILTQEQLDKLAKLLRRTNATTGNK